MRKFVLCNILLCLFVANACSNATSFSIDGSGTCIDGLFESCKQKEEKKRQEIIGYCAAKSATDSDKVEINNIIDARYTDSIDACYIASTKRCKDRLPDEQADCYVPKEYKLSFKITGVGNQIVSIHNEINDDFYDCAIQVVKNMAFLGYCSKDVFTKSWLLDESTADKYEKRNMIIINNAVNNIISDNPKEWSYVLKSVDSDGEYRYSRPSFRPIDFEVMNAILKRYNHDIADCYQQVEMRNLQELMALRYSEVSYNVMPTFKNDNGTMRIAFEIDNNGNVTNVDEVNVIGFYGAREAKTDIFSCIKEKALHWQLDNVENECIIETTWEFVND